MSATSALREEHRNVLRMTEAMTAIAAQLRSGAESPPMGLEEIDRFLDSYLQCHQDKEETLLFPALMGSDAPVVFGVVGILVAGHDRGRLARSRIDRVLAQGGQPGSALADALEDFAVQMERHIALEETECYNIADISLFPEVQDFLAQSYETFERERHGAAGHSGSASTLETIETLARSGA